MGTNKRRVVLHSEVCLLQRWYEMHHTIQLVEHSEVGW